MLNNDYFMATTQKQKKLEIYLFISFLSKNNVWSRFVYYYNNPTTAFKDNQEIPLSKYLRIESSCDFLECSYDWDGTTEGFEFWATLSYDWEILLEQYEKDSTDFC